MKSSMTPCMKFIKYLLFLFNLLFLISGLTFVVFGAIVNIQFKDYLQFTGDASIGSLSLLLVCCGIVIALISFFGCCGGFKENRCMLITFASFLVFLFVGEIAIAFVAFALKERLYTFLQTEMYASINSTKYEVMRTWSIVQKEFDCCGFDGPNDWKARSTYLPDSCCKITSKCPTESNPAFTTGCYEAIVAWFNMNLTIILPVMLTVCLIQLIGTVLSCMLSKSIKRGYEIVKA